MIINNFVRFKKFNNFFICFIYNLQIVGPPIQTSRGWARTTWGQRWGKAVVSKLATAMLSRGWARTSVGASYDKKEWRVGQRRNIGPTLQENGKRNMGKGKCQILKTAPRKSGESKSHISGMWLLPPPPPEMNAPALVLAQPREVRHCVAVRPTDHFSFLVGFLLFALLFLGRR